MSAMGVIYLAALIVGLGIMIVQVIVGSDDHAMAHHAGGVDHDGHGSSEAGIVGVLRSFRFFIFGALGFGLCGTLLHFLNLAGPLATFLIATAAGIGSGAFAVFALRAVLRGSVSSTAIASAAVGKTARVLVPLAKGQVGQIRVELQGTSVDMMAMTDEETIARGELVLVESIDGGAAMVSKAPKELT